jgi:hypothetical protein
MHYCPEVEDSNSPFTQNGDDGVGLEQVLCYISLSIIPTHPYPNTHQLRSFAIDMIYNFADALLP